MKTNIANSFVKLLQNLSIEERLRQIIREETRKEKEVEREGLAQLVETFNLFCQYNALHAEMYPHDTVISFEQVQSLPEYQAEVDSVRSDSFFSPSSLSLSNDDIEKYSKMLAFVNFTAAREKDQSSDHSEPRPSKRMRM